MDRAEAPLAESPRVPSMRELCLKSIALKLPGDVHVKVQQLVPHLLPDDAVEVLDQYITAHAAQIRVCPFHLLLPQPRGLLLSTHLRAKLLRICRRALQNAASLSARDTLLCQISSSISQQELVGPLEFGAFLCEIGWYEDGMLILEKIYSVLTNNPSWCKSEMSLDCSYRQLVSSVAAGRVTAARQHATRVRFLYGHGLGRQSGLLSAAAAAMVRLYLLTENWPEAARYLSAALDELPSAVPADVAAELARLVAELLLSRGHTAPLIELVPQALSAAYRHWGELHPQTLAAGLVMVDFAMHSGLSGIARDLCEVMETLSEELFGDASPMRQRVQLDSVLLALKLSAGDLSDTEPDSMASSVRPSVLPVPRDSCWLLERTLADCQWMDEQIRPMYDTEQQSEQAYSLSRQIMSQLMKTSRLCEDLFGPDSLRLARVLTELGRQYFSLEMDGLLQPSLDGAAESERLLRRALAIQAGHVLPSHQRDGLVTRITLGCLYTYSNRQYLLEGERLMRAALNDCYGGEQKRHLDLAEHCLRGLCYIYGLHDDTNRVAAMEELLETVQAQRRRLGGQRVPAEGLVALLPRRPWTQRELIQQLKAALRAVSTVAPPGQQQAAGASGGGGGAQAGDADGRENAA